MSRGWALPVTHRLLEVASLLAVSRGWALAVTRRLLAVASLVAECGLCGVQASAVVAHGLSCPVACGIFLDRESNPRPLH